MRTMKNRKKASTRGKTIISVFFLTFTILMASCSDEQKSEPELIREQITQYNEQIVELNQKISELERQLEDMGETTQNRIRTPITVKSMEYGPFDHYFRVNASVEAVREAMISPEANGQIKEIPVVKGQQVRRGQVLARLNTSVIESNIEEVKTSLQLAETVYNRQKRLWEQEIGSEIQYLEARNNYQSMQSRLQTLESQLDMSIIRAPFDGLIDEIFAKEGEMAMPGSMIMQMLNLDQLFVNADVSESFLPAVNPNDKVILRFPAFPGYEERVPIHRLGNVINPENRTFRLQLRIDNPDRNFKPNMTAGISIKSFSTDSAIVVPSIFIKQDVQGQYVYVARENNDGDLVARKIYVERGLSGEGQTMIKYGLNPGDLLINRGHNRVSEGTLVRISEEREMASAN